MSEKSFGVEVPSTFERDQSEFLPQKCHFRPASKCRALGGVNGGLSSYLISENSQELRRGDNEATLVSTNLSEVTIA